jgi:hypothetical protein
MNPGIYILLVVAIVTLGLCFKLYPVFPTLGKTTIRYNTVENFSSPAVAPNQPACIKRNVDAQALLHMFPQCDDDKKSPSEDAMNRIELKLILNKLTCLDADVTNSGVAGYNTLKLPYNTSHDTEPITNFVGRCLNGGARTRDIDLIMSKYESRGNTLIAAIASLMHINPKPAFKHYRSVLRVTHDSLLNNCKMKRASLDIPAGVRDPGYSIPFSIEKLAPFYRKMD